MRVLWRRPHERHDDPHVRQAAQPRAGAKELITDGGAACIASRREERPHHTAHAGVPGQPAQRDLHCACWQGAAQHVCAHGDWRVTIQGGASEPLGAQLLHRRQGLRPGPKELHLYIIRGSAPKVGRGACAHVARSELRMERLQHGSIERRPLLAAMGARVL